MTNTNKTGNIEDSIKTELEHVYVMASYVDAEQGRFDIVRHLVSAAIDEMENLIGEPLGRRPKPIRRNGTGRVKSSAQR